jgi:hypothetical protein
MLFQSRTISRNQINGGGSVTPCTFVEVKGFIDPGWLVEIEMDCIAE